MPAFQLDTPGLKLDLPGLKLDHAWAQSTTGTRVSTIKYDIKGLTPEGVTAKIRISTAGCTGNPDITGATALVTAANNACTAVDAKLLEIVNLENQLKQARIDRDRLVDTAVLAWKTLGTKVEEVTGGDAGKIVKAGFEVASGPTTRPMPDQIANLYAEATKKAGEIRVKHDRDKNAASYEYQTSPDPFSESTWTHRLTSSKSRNLIASLPAAPKLWVRARGIKGDYQGPWSDPALTSVN